MITRVEYLKTLKIVKNYREQIKSEKKAAREIADSKFLSEFDIPVKLQKLLGEHFIYNDRKQNLPGLKWDAYFGLLTVADLRRKPYRIEDLSRFRGIGEKTIDELKKVYTELGL